MPEIKYTFSEAKLERLSNAMGYQTKILNPEDGGNTKIPNPETREQFVNRVLLENLKNAVKEHEGRLAYKESVNSNNF